MQDIEKEFKPTSWSIDNKVSIYVGTIIICLAGILTYIGLPKENFPEVVLSTNFYCHRLPRGSTGRY
jgi:multidrug efflux pump